MNKFFLNLLLFLIFPFLNINSSLAQILTESYQLEHYEDLKRNCIEKRDYKCAAETLTKIIQMQPKDVENYTKLGMVNYCLGNYQEAISLFKKTIDLSRFPDAVYDNEDLGDAHMFLGITYHTLEKEKEAREELNTALKYYEKEAELDGIIYINVLLKEINKNISE